MPDEPALPTGLTPEEQTRLDALKPEQRRWVISQLLNLPQSPEAASAEHFHEQIAALLMVPDTFKILTDSSYGIEERFIKKIKMLGSRVDLRIMKGFEAQLRQTLAKYMEYGWSHRFIVVCSELGQGMNLTPEIKKFFTYSLGQHRIHEAVQIRDRLGQDIDFSAEIKKFFLNRIIDIEFVQKIRDELGQGLDFTDEIKKGFINWLASNPEYALRIRDQLGHGIDFRSIKGYETAARQSFRKYLEIAGKPLYFKDERGQRIPFSPDQIKESQNLSKTWVKKALEIRGEFGQGINFSSEIKQGFLQSLENARGDAALQIRDELGQDIDFRSAEGYEAAVKKGFMDRLKQNEVDAALQIRDELGQDIDFRSAEGYEAAVKKGFMDRLKQNEVDAALQIRHELGQGIDFPSTEGYEAAVKKGFMDRLKQNEVDAALQIRDELGQDIDFSAIENYSDTVRFSLMKRLKEGHFDDARKIHDQVGQGIDLSSGIKFAFQDQLRSRAYATARKISDEFGQGIDFIPEIKQGFLSALENRQFAAAEKIRETFGLGIDFTQEIQQAFLSLLVSGPVEDALKIRDELGQGIDFTQEIHQSYLWQLKNRQFAAAEKIRETFGLGIDFTQEIQQAFLSLLVSGPVEDALKIRDELGQGIDFRSIADYDVAVGQRFLRFVQYDQVDDALKIRDIFGQDIDFTREIKQGFLDCLNEGWRGEKAVVSALRIHDELGQGLDFTSEIEQGLLNSLKNGWVEKALLIHDTFGQGIDFRSVEGYEVAVKKMFTDQLTQIKIGDALQIRDKLGQGIDFSSEIKQVFLAHLQDQRLWRGEDVKQPALALEIRDKLGQGIDFSSEIKQGFINGMKEGKSYLALEIHDQLGRGIDFRTIEGYEDEVRGNYRHELWLADFHIVPKIRDQLGQGLDFAHETKLAFLGCLKDGRIDKALQIRDEFGQGLDFTSEIKQGFLTYILKEQGAGNEKKPIDIALQIRDKLGQGIDFPTIEGYEIAVKKVFLTRLQAGWINDALQIRDKLGQGIDFRTIEGYGDAVRLVFLNQLKKGQVDAALHTRDTFGQGLVLTTEIKQCFLHCLQQGALDSALKIRNQLGPELDFGSEIDSAAKAEPGILIKFGVQANDPNPIAKAIRAFGVNETECLNQAAMVIANCKKVEKNFGEAIGRLDALLVQFPVLWKALIYPTILSQKVGAFLCLDGINRLWDMKADFSDPNVVGLIKYITTQCGTRAADILVHFLAEGLKKGKIRNICAESDIIRGFISEGGIPLTEIYEAYRVSWEGVDMEAYREIIADTKAIQERVAGGTCTPEDFENRFFAGIEFYTFPPAVGVDRVKYNNLIASREDRQEDVPNTLDKWQGHELNISQGGYRMKEGENLDVSAWNVITRVTEEENKTDVKALNTDLPRLGQDLMESLGDKKLVEKQEAFLRRLYRLYREKGNLLPEEVRDHRELMAIKEYVGDHLNDLIGLCISAWQKADPDGFAKWQKKEEEGRRKGARGLVKSLRKILKNHELVPEKKEEVLRSVFHSQGFTVEGSLMDTLSAFTTDGELEEYLVTRTSGGGQKYTLVIKNGLLGKEYEAMYSESKKFEFSEGAGKETLTCMVSKRKEHACAGLNMGVCVAPDETLWNTPGFMNVLLKKENIFYGGMHFMVTEGDGKIKGDEGGSDMPESGNYLVLPGINPSDSLLGQVAADDLFGKMMDYALKCAKAMGANRVLIPKNSSIHSNRSAIQEVISKKATDWKTFIFDEVMPFSTSPYKYHFQDCWVVEL